MLFRDVTVLLWSARSPDLSSIQHVWNSYNRALGSSTTRNDHCQFDRSGAADLAQLLSSTYLFPSLYLKTNVLYLLHSLIGFTMSSTLKIVISCTRKESLSSEVAVTILKQRNVRGTSYIISKWSPSTGTIQATQTVSIYKHIYGRSLCIKRLIITDIKI